MFKKVKNPWVRGALIVGFIAMLLCCVVCVGTIATTSFTVNAYPVCSDANEFGRLYDQELSDEAGTCMYEGDIIVDGFYKFVDFEDGQSAAVLELTIYGASQCWMGAIEDEALLQPFTDENLVIPLREERFSIDLSCRSFVEGDMPHHFQIEVPSEEEVVPDTIWEQNA